MEALKPLTIDPVHDVLHYENHPLHTFFQPRTVAVIGATEKAGSVGRTLLWNLITNPFGGTVFPVNLKRGNVLGIKAYPTIGEVPEKVDLAVIVTPAPAVPDLIGQCVDAGVKNAIVISAGFKELGPPGVALEQGILAHARRGGMRVVGPNCLGIMSPLSGLNATFAAAMARPGNVAFISQSGALLTAVLDWSLTQNVGYSAIVSVGSMVDVGWGDLIDYFGNDPRTNSIVIYMESIGDARGFLSAAREVALSKPILVIKAGRSAQAAKAAASHTGALTGSDEVLNAAFRRCGVVRVESIADLFYVAEVLSKQPRPLGPRLTILTNAGGPGVLATDALIANNGALSEISTETMGQLNNLLPPHWSRNNPIDILGDAEPERYARALEIASNDPGSDGMLVILTPQDMTDPTQTAEALKKYASIEHKPVLASWMGGPIVAAGEAILNRANIPTFPYPDTAARIFTYMWRYSYNLKGLYETPAAIREMQSPEREAAARLIESVRAEGRTILTEFESKQVLNAYRIPSVETRIAQQPEHAVAAADAIGYPVVLKLHSKTITHKTDVGGVQLNLKSAGDVRQAFEAIRKSVAERAGAADFLGVTVQPMIRMEGYELILGSSIDPQFGPVMLFGTGGQLVEVFKDRALALPPLNTTLVRRMLEHTKIVTALRGVRGRKPVNMAELEELMVNFSHLAVEQRWIKEIDINPLLASAERLLALDARIVLHPPETTEEQLPQLAIRPYPNQYATEWEMPNGVKTLIRPIRPEDEPLMTRFHESLSERSVYFRYLQPLQLSRRVAHERLTRICYIDYAREIALVAERRIPTTGQREILGVGRFRRLRGTRDADCAILVGDEWQRHGLGSRLMELLIQVAREEKLRRLIAIIHPDNEPMQTLCKRLGFALTKDEAEGLVRGELTFT